MPMATSLDIDDSEKYDTPIHVENSTTQDTRGGGPSSTSTPLENNSSRAADAALEILSSAGLGLNSTTGAGKPRLISAEEDKRVLRKIDLWIMPVVLMVYFLQQLDKSSLSYTSVFGIVQETHLVGTQYSWLTSIVYIAQLIWQPISSYMLVKLPVAKCLFVHVAMWGIVVASTAAAKDFKGLIAARFFLGIFESTVAPTFITITQMWWRRREQTLRLAIWFAANGATGMVGSLLTWGLGHISGKLFPYQTIFLFIGLLTFVLSPIVLLVLPDSPTKAKFLSREEKVVAIERLRANNQGTETKVWKWEQVREMMRDPKTYLWFMLLFACAVPSGGISAFGPLIIQGFGFNPFSTILFNIPFSFFQICITLLAALLSQRYKLKFPIVFGLTIPPIAGVVGLFVLGRGIQQRGRLLGCYYVISSFSAIQPMLYTWASQNTAGHTKKTCTTGMIFVAQCAGNVVGPLLYKTEDKPYYRNGLMSSLICWIAVSVLTLITATYLHYLNAQHASARRRLGKAVRVVDTSLDKNVMGDDSQVGEKDEGVRAVNEKSFLDLTDGRNEDFIYVL